MRIIGAVLTVTASFLVGCVLSRRLERHRKSLEALITALEYLKTQICVFDTGMRRALTNTEYACPFYGMFSDAAHTMNDDGLRTAWRRSAEAHSREAELDAGDTETLMRIGDRLGVTSAENQRQNIDAATDILRRRLSAVRVECAEKGQLYRSCGLLFGVFFALIFL